MRLPPRVSQPRRLPASQVGLLALFALLPAGICFGENPANESAPADSREFENYVEEVPAGDKTLSFEMVAIPGGRFEMGSPEDEAGRFESEGPQFNVEVEPFWMGRHEVTWALYDRFMKEYDQYRDQPETHINPTDVDAVSFPTPLYEPGHTFEKGHEPNEPAVTMTQFAARQFTKWLSLKSGRIYRLPTEAEWEYAARAGTDTAYHFGDDPAQLDQYAWYFDNAEEKYHAVGLKKPNPWGLYDMHGNVAEWVLDAYDEQHYQQFADRQGVPAAEAANWPTDPYPIVVRGGSWFDFPEDLRSAARRGSDREWSGQDPQVPNSIWWHTDARFVGFRVVRPVETPTAEQLQRYWGADVGLIADVLELKDTEVSARLQDAQPLPQPISP